MKKGFPKLSADHMYYIRRYSLDDCSRGAAEFYSSDIIEVEEVRQKCK